ncbi:MAG TPA: hypothetical protein VKI40_08005 [Terriglobales bacterium]|nr:hypothetical protein [Terriglobales bacterium]
MKSLEQQLNEQAAEIRELRKITGKKVATTNVARELSESGLPDISQSRLRKRLRGSESASEIKAAIAQERALVRSVRNQGGHVLDLVEADRLVEGYRRIGLNEREARIAANVEEAVKGVQQNQAKLANAAKLLGMSDAEALVFSKI